MPTSYDDQVAAARAPVAELTPAELAARLAGARPPLVIDCREPHEVASGAIAGAIALPRTLLAQRIADAAPDPAGPIVTYCATGARSALAAATLIGLGYGDVANLGGGVAAWRAQGLPLERPRDSELSDAQRARYARQIVLPQVGEAGQRRLLDARVLLVGAGGLGSPAALYLAAAGVGTLGLVDDDVVDASNLQRQVLHGEATEGLSKIASARATLARLNSACEVVGYEERLTAGNIRRIFGAGWEVVVDGTDSFATRYLINDACVLLGVPSVYGAVHHFDGQVSVFAHDQGPCYRCLYPSPPPPGVAPSCAEAAVLGAVPGVIGTLQATETLKLLLGVGAPLVGRLLSVDLLTMRLRELRVRPDPRCPACGVEPTITEPVDVSHAQ
ncbi:MAG: molybdopterin biosynthesis protein MoeB [Proteobacteria bacterium]|nr:MAG: molybdopterin biosynthesis protein MoeB [Pseudomonadota bacterium]